MTVENAFTAGESFAGDEDVLRAETDARTVWHIGPDEVHEDTVWTLKAAD